MIEELCSGFCLFFTGTEAFFKDRSLWKFAAVPLAVMAAVYAAAVWISVVFSLAAAQKLEKWLSSSPGWNSQLAGVFSVSAAVICIILVLAVLLFTASVFYETLAGPFCDRLIAAYLKKKGDFTEPEISLLQTLLFLKDSFFCSIKTLLGTLFFSIIGLFLPVIGPFLLFLFASYRLGITWLMPAGFVCGISFKNQKQLLQGKKMTVLGFGTAAYLFWLLPLASFIFLPGLVLGGTELLLELKKKESR